jgi:hypothetical protein
VICILSPHPCSYVFFLFIWSIFLLGQFFLCCRLLPQLHLICLGHTVPHLRADRIHPNRWSTHTYICNRTEHAFYFIMSLFCVWHAGRYVGRSIEPCVSPLFFRPLILGELSLTITITGYGLLYRQLHPARYHAECQEISAQFFSSRVQSWEGNEQQHGDSVIGPSSWLGGCSAVQLPRRWYGWWGGDVYIWRFVWFAVVDVIRKVMKEGWSGEVGELNTPCCTVWIEMLCGVRDLRSLEVSGRLIIMMDVLMYMGG